MNRIMSVYLDLIRFVVAVVILLVHARYDRFTSGWLAPFKNYGNDAVMIFFVLSGFVIAYCIDQKEKTFVDYTISRLARLYSVVIPAIFLTVALDLWGYSLDPMIYEASWFERPILRLLANLFFVSQLWFADIGAFSNAPFWSLGYEFWYYVMFGVMSFTTGNKRILLSAAVAVVIGPKILLLLPVWLMGVWAYRVTRQRTFSGQASLFLIFGSILAYVVLRAADLPLRLDWRMALLLGTDFYEGSLAESRNFLFSYIAGALVAANFIGFSSLSKTMVNKKIPFERTIRFLASYTFRFIFCTNPYLTSLLRLCITTRTRQSIRHYFSCSR